MIWCMTVSRVVWWRKDYFWLRQLFYWVDLWDLLVFMIRIRWHWAIFFWDRRSGVSISFRMITCVRFAFFWVVLSWFIFLVFFRHRGVVIVDWSWDWWRLYCTMMFWSDWWDSIISWWNRDWWWVVFNRFFYFYWVNFWLDRWDLRFIFCGRVWFIYW